MELMEYWAVIIKRWYIIFFVTLIAGSVSFYYSYYVIKPIYSASTTLLLNVSPNASPDGTTIDGLMRSQIFDEAVITEARLKVDTTTLASMLATNLTGELLTITITGPSQRVDAHMANAFASTFETDGPPLMHLPTSQVVTPAVVNPRQFPISPRKKRNVSFAAAIAVLFSTGLAFLLEYFDMRLKTEDDVKRHLNIPVLATIQEYKVKA